MDPLVAVSVIAYCPDGVEAVVEMDRVDWKEPFAVRVPLLGLIATTGFGGDHVNTWSDEVRDQGIIRPDKSLT